MRRIVTASESSHRPSAIITRWEILMLACLLMVAGLNPEVAHAKAPTPDGFWLRVHGGVTLNSSIRLSRSGNENQLAPSEEAKPVFGLYFGYRFPSLDLGLLVDNFDGGTFQGQDRTRTIGGRSRFAAAVSWRYLDKQWGSLSLGFRPGVVIAAHSDHIRSQVAQSLGLPATQIEGIDTYNAGFVMGSVLTMTWHLSEALSFFIEAEAIFADLKLQGTDDRVEMLMVQPLFNFGLLGKL